MPLTVSILLLLAHIALAQQSTLDQQYEAAQHALIAGDYAAARRQFEELVRTHPEIAEVHANLGLVYFEEKRFEQAIPELRRALKLKPTLAKSATVLAMSLSELGRYKEALPGLEKGFRSADRETKRICGLQLERAYTGLQEHGKAVEIALEMSRSFPDDPEVLYHNGRIFGNFAFLAMQKLSQVAPDSVWTHQAAAEAYESERSYSSAIGQYRSVLAKEARRPGIHYRLGRTLLARARATTSAEDLDAAIKEFEDELTLDPLNANAAYELAEIHRGAGRFAESQQLFERALKFHPDFEEAHLGLASVLKSQGMKQQAVPHLQRAIELNSDNEVSWYRLAQIQQSLGNTAEAQEAFARFRQLHQQTTEREEAGRRFFSTDEVTKQTLDTDAPQ